MLPLPSSTSKRNRTYFPSLPANHNHNLSSSQQILQTLRSRTRLTNLAVFLLLFCLSGSLILNLNYLLIPSSSTFNSSSSSRLRNGKVNSKGWDDLITPSQLRSGIPLSIETTIERDSRYNDLDHLIMVPGHAIWLGHDASKVNENDDWILEPMQKGGSVRTYVKHIQRGVEELKKDNKALLVFSGGATRVPPSPPLPEALSYHNLAHALDLLPSTPIPAEQGESRIPLSLNLRAATEEHALDSYENLLFSIARFKEVTDRYPRRITVVGYGMKERRFTNLHRSALSFPLTNFTYVGINDDLPDLSKHYAGELKFGFKPFLNSPTGCHPPLSTKKLLRNPYIKYHPYHISNPQLIELFEWCPPLQDHKEFDSLDDYRDVYGTSFSGRLPWNSDGSVVDDEQVMWDRERD
ncbi:cytoplasmic protein [Kwoniella mangroviensis CBS 10435]|uniref:Cytoplasmic protein n=1 Tax=Kwoniella mangroviensis CBS 10435 TaxID=1331196 RepID=A0A1B9IU81_9TREE|nr:cytoplasmic protein [Kwoniella mangroviensis CBS 10435]